MRVALHVIHPYSYKQQGGQFVPGPSDIWRGRDERVSELVSETFAAGNRVVVHHANHAGTLDGAIHAIGLLRDPLFAFIADARASHPVTTPVGQPIPCSRPEKIPEDRWDWYTKVYTNDADFERGVGKQDSHLIIGGYLQACVGNAASYIKNVLAKDGERVCIVRDLCVIWDEPEAMPAEDAMREITKSGIEIITADCALRIVKCAGQDTTS